ncbi:unnamed protein product [Nippostrongylus brasiliensis]|uniref:Gamma-tubulin complex component n=1 Tax=Nippostrongylus brasiliensis TaxID=27835 RepID=A0A0N4Y3S8_NIPBR|nr:unnamed protein product [Nippostrongylus brasiliensis]
MLFHDRLVSKRFAFLGAYPPCPWYHPLKDDFATLIDVSPEEQEHFMNDEVRMFLAGFESENIRFVYERDSECPVGLRVNPSLDPFMRAISDQQLRVLKHDYGFSLTSRAVAEEIQKRLCQLIHPIVETESYDLADYGLNTLSRSVTAIQSSIKLYANVLSTLRKEHLIGGQVLTLLYNMRMKVVVEKDMRDLHEIFQVAWKIFAERVGAWVEQGRVNDTELEFMVWPTSSLSPVCTNFLSEGKVKLDSSEYVLVEELCPSFLSDLLPSIAKCGNYNNMMSKARMTGEKISTDWSNLNVTELHRKAVIVVNNGLIRVHASLFRLSIAPTSVFEAIRRSVMNDAPCEAVEEPAEVLFTDVLSLTYTPPSKIEKLIPLHIVEIYCVVFRLCLLLNTSVMNLSEAIFELGLARDPVNAHRACILSALYRNVVDLATSLSNAITGAVLNFSSEMAKESGLSQWRKVAYMKRLVDIVCRLGVTGLLQSATLAEDYYVILEDVESMQIVE